MKIVRDTGSAFPILAGNTGTISSVTTGTFSTAAANTLIVVSVGLGNFTGTAQTPVSVTWNGGAPAGASTFTKQIEGDYSSLGNHTASIWTATCSQTISAQSIVVAGNASVASTAISVHVDALTFATTTGGVSQSANTTVMDVTLTGVTSGSWLYVAAFGEATTTLSTDANTTQTNSAVIGGSVIAANGTNETGTSGNILVGWSTTESFSAVAALEIKAVTSASIESREETLGTAEAQAVQKLYPPYTFFQQNAFQSNAFAILGGTTGSAGPSGSETDTLGTSDPQGSKQTQVSSETDTLGFSDPQAATKGVRDSQTDTLGFSDVQGAGVGKASAQSDTLGFSDPQESKQEQKSSQTDTLGFSDPQASKQTQVSSEADTLGFSDPQDATQGQAASQADTLGFSDPQAAAVSGGGAFSGSHVDTLGLSDSQVADVLRAASQADTLGFGEGQDCVIGKAVTLSEALGMADAYAAAVYGGPDNSETDTLGFGDAYAAANSAIQGSHNDVLGLGDAYAAAVGGVPALKQRFHVWSGTGWV